MVVESAPARIGGSARGKGGALFGASVAVNAVDVLAITNKMMLAWGPASMMVFGEKTADYLEGRAIRRFAASGDDASGDWQPLAPATQHIRASMGYGPDGPINVRMNELIEWAVYSKDIQPLPGGGVEVTSPDANRMGDSALEKLKTAQMGKTQSSGPFAGSVTPPRPVAALSERDMVDIVALLQIHVMGVATDAVAGLL